MDAHYSVQGAVLTGRNTTPSHFLFKIESFSLLSKANIDQYRSEKFEASGLIWKLSIYPIGDKSKNGGDHISIYLDMADKSFLPVGGDVNVIVNFFVFNHLQDRYLSFQDGRVHRYHALKMTWGITKFIDVEKFSNPENGYLIDDTCVFGVEIFVIKNTLRRERLSMMKEPSTYFKTWNVTSFSYLRKESYESKSFGCYYWKILLYPKGCVEAKGNSISIFLDVSRLDISSDIKIFVKFILRVKDQLNGNHIECKANNVYCSTSNTEVGQREFVSLAKLGDPKLGFLVDDSLIIEAEVTLLGLVLSES